MRPLSRLLSHRDSTVRRQTCQIFLNVTKFLNPDVLLPLAIYEPLVKLLNVADTATLLPAVQLMKVMALRFAIEIGSKDEIREDWREKGRTLPDVFFPMRTLCE
jgi:hypothetical protein